MFIHVSILLLEFILIVFLNIIGCIRLKSLPKNLHKFKRLQTISCAGCLEIKSFPEIEENMGRLRELDFSRTGIIEVHSSIRHLHGLEYLNLSHCLNLLSLPDSIYSLSPLTTLLMVNCPKFKAIVDVNDVNMEVCLGSLQHLIVTCHILKAGVIWENNCFSSLKTLNPQWDQRVEVIPNHIYQLSSMVQLCIENSASRRFQNDGFHLLSLKIESPRNYHLMKGRNFNDIFHQPSLENLFLLRFDFKEGGIPLDNWYLPSLLSLSLRYCNLMEGEVLNHVCHLSSLTELDLQGSCFSSIPVGITQLPNLRVLNLSRCNHFSSIPAGISQLSNLRVLNLSYCNYFSSIPAGICRLSNLRVLNLSHCKNLQQIPDLPSSLPFLDACGSDRISSSFSFLIDWFKSKLNQV